MRPTFDAPERWHEPQDSSQVRVVLEPAGPGFIHPLTAEDVRARLRLLPVHYQHRVEVVQFSRMSKKRALFPCYGLQWGASVYLYPIEDSLIETFSRPPLPQQIIEARMYGGRWIQEGSLWRLAWTMETLRDFYLNNVLIHEIGHVVDDRNTRPADRERFADWFAIEYGYRFSRRRTTRSR